MRHTRAHSAIAICLDDNARGMVWVKKERHMFLRDLETNGRINMQKRHKGLALLLAGLALSTATIVPGRAQDTIKIGLIDDMNGPYSSLSGPGSLAAVEMAVEDFGGNVLGRKIEIIVVDDQNKTDLAVAGARELYTRDGVGMITGLTSSASALAVQGVAHELGKISIVTTAATSTLTDEACSPTGFHWTSDTYAVTRSLVDHLVGAGHNDWFFISVDYLLGKTIEGDARRAIEKRGGTTIGSTKHPLGNGDFSSQVLTAQGSGARTIALANGGADTENSLKAINEFNVLSSGVSLAVFFMHTPIIDAIGQDLAKGLFTATPFFPEMNEDARSFTKRFQAKRLRPAAPTINQAMAYSATRHYLRAVEAAGTDQTAAVVEKMKELPVDDFLTNGARLRDDGRLMREIYVVEVKDPLEASSPTDYFNLIATVPGELAFRPKDESRCNLLQ